MLSSQQRIVHNPTGGPQLQSVRQLKHRQSSNRQVILATNGRVKLHSTKPAYKAKRSGSWSHRKSQNGQQACTSTSFHAMDESFQSQEAAFQDSQCSYAQLHRPSQVGARSPEQVKLVIGSGLRHLLVPITAATLLLGAPAVATESKSLVAEQELSVSDSLAPVEAGNSRRMLTTPPSPSQMSVETELSAISRIYDDLLQTRPLATKIVTGIVGTILGDVLAQSCSNNGKKFDWLRTMRLITFSAVVGTPMCHYWFQFLDAAIFPNNPTALQTVVLKVLADQSLMAPFGTSLFFSGIKVLEGNPRAAASAVRSQLPGALKANYVLWPLANLINFAYVPSAYRILYCNVISIFWSAFLSTLANGGSAPLQTPSVPKVSLGFSPSWKLQQLRSWMAKQYVPLQSANLSAGQLMLLAVCPLLVIGELLPTPQEPVVKTIGQQLQTWQPVRQFYVRKEVQTAPQLVYTSAPAAAVYADFKAAPSLSAVVPPPRPDAFSKAISSDTSCTTVSITTAGPEASIRTDFVCPLPTKTEDKKAPANSNASMMNPDGSVAGHSA